ncbi:MAG: hypothetical protein Q9219_001000 [cf. Caloplaca sp. 3 TL-2023]
MASAFPTPNKPLTWLITSSSSGFGFSHVRIVQAKGHKDIATLRSHSRTPGLVDEVENKGGKWMKLDMTDLDSSRVIEELKKNSHQIDVLVNDAGYTTFVGVEQCTEKEARDLTETMSVLFDQSRVAIYAETVIWRSRKNLRGASLEAYLRARAGLGGMIRVLVPLNIRILSTCAGVFNTNIGSAAVPGKNLSPEDYKGSMVD